MQFANLPVDRDRVYLTGYSMGGYGTWTMLAKRPQLFAAAIPVAGGGDPQQAKLYNSIPIWVFHGESDLIVRASESQKMVQALKAAHGKIQYTEFNGVGHKGVSRRVYTDPRVHEWLFRQSRPPHDR